MLAELRQKSQITIPKEIVAKLGLHEGDKLEVTEQDGAIFLMPVVVYPKKYVDELRGEIEEAKAKIASGKQPVFNSVDALFAKLEEN
ncbi:MAG: AbrB/MazE/SpoVT family DNA-binding domain-containing protein [Clostridiales bacterium]|jgi:AbrB family looped-hinge helix DNA binding protein|nr:AbrB/MazE/SpoVT family DNA-binding domain-containing protein [Clostridiales bacterium]